MRYITLLALLLCSCGWPIDPKSMPDVLKALGSDTASGCFWIGGRGGGGAMAVSPVPVVPGGGYGSGEVLFGRVNSPDTSLSIQNGNCTISRGPDITKTTP